MKTKNKKAISTLIAVTVAFSILVTFSATASAGTVEVSPATQNVLPEVAFYVDIYIEDVTYMTADQATSEIPCNSEDGTVTISRPEVWVDDDYTNATPGWGYDHFDKIQDGIDAVAGSTVNVAAGTYDEQVTIDKANLTLVSNEFQTNGTTTKDTTLIDAGGGAGSKGISITANGVTVQGFTIHNYENGVYVENSAATIDNCIIYNTGVTGVNPRGIQCYLKQASGAFVAITNNEIYGNVRGGGWIRSGGRGINVYSDAAGSACGALIDNNEIYGNDQRGISVFYIPATITSNDIHDIGVDYTNRLYNVGILLGWNKGNTLVQGNTIEGITPGNYVYAAGVYLFADTAAGFGYEAGYYGSITINNNTIDTGSTASGINLNCPNETTFDISVTNNTISGSTSGLGGIYAWSMEDYIAYVDSIEYNTITGNAEGILLWRCDVGSLHCNNIYGNTDYGVENYNAENDVDATCNWWGNHTGPYHPTTNPTGFGDKVSDNVDYDPWLTYNPSTSSLVYTGDPQPTAAVVLEATLSDLTLTGISGVDVDFYIDNNYVGNATTDSNGVASCSIAYPVGIYDVYASVCCLESDPALLAIYDPAGGFVTGGGWINSPEGAYVPDPDAEGKANFGFVSKYKKGQSTPTGNTEFQFKAGDLNFQSDSYDWLVIAGHKAMYKGTGTINGAGNYGFMLSAIDEKLTLSTDDVDKFRIRIGDKDNDDENVYDNQIGDSDADDPTTEIAGGQIVIRKAK